MEAASTCLVLILQTIVSNSLKSWNKWTTHMIHRWSTFSPTCFGSCDVIAQSPGPAAAVHVFRSLHAFLWNILGGALIRCTSKGSLLVFRGDVFSRAWVHIIKRSSSFPCQQPLGIDCRGVLDKDFTRGKMCSGQAVSGSAAPNDPQSSCDLGAPNRPGEELVTLHNKALPLQRPPLQVKGSTSYTCQGCDLSPLSSLSSFASLSSPPFPHLHQHHLPYCLQMLRRLNKLFYVIKIYSTANSVSRRKWKHSTWFHTPPHPPLLLMYSDFICP